MPLRMQPAGGAPTILCLGAHSDDIEIGACATLLGLARRYPAARVVWCVLGAAGDRADEAQASAERCTAAFASTRIVVDSFRDGYFPSAFAAIKDRFEELKADCRPDLIFTHYRNDGHQDHRLIHELTLQTFRNHLVWEYEIPKYDGDLGSPNVFVPVPEPLLEEKLSILDEFFGSQRSKSWFTPDTFRAMMRLRGIECRSPTGFAEAFYCRKAVIE